jgi:hypothetical protein
VPKKFVKVKVTVRYKVEVNELYPFDLEDEAETWKSLIDTDLDIIDPKIRVEKAR